MIVDSTTKPGFARSGSSKSCVVKTNTRYRNLRHAMSSKTTRAVVLIAHGGSTEVCIKYTGRHMRGYGSHFLLEYCNNTHIRLATKQDMQTLKNAGCFAVP